MTEDTIAAADDLVIFIEHDTEKITVTDLVSVYLFGTGFASCLDDYSGYQAVIVFYYFAAVRNHDCSFLSLVTAVVGIIVYLAVVIGKIVKINRIKTDIDNCGFSFNILDQGNKAIISVIFVIN